MGFIPKTHKKMGYVAKNGFKWLFFVWERHISIQMLGCPSICPSVAPLKTLCNQLLPEVSRNHCGTLHV